MQDCAPLENTSVLREKVIATSTYPCLRSRHQPPASAVQAVYDVLIVDSDEHGNVDAEDLRKRQKRTKTDSQIP